MMIALVLAITGLLPTVSAEELTLAGTPAHREVEFKMAFRVSPRTRLGPLSEKIRQRLQKAMLDQKLSFPEALGHESFHVSPFQTYAFRDTYFDTSSNLVLNSRSSYRLRYRWPHYGLYKRYQVFPFISSFYPNRCEVQYKQGYTFLTESDIASVFESRFEFRNESSPFNLKKDAPKPPWRFDDFLQHALSGRYRNYKMMPYAELAENSLKSSEDKILPRLTLLTARRRTHLNAENPWGRLPNPEQVFIVTLDLVTVENAVNELGNPIDKSRFKNLAWLEIEIEADRSTLTNLKNSSLGIFEISKHRRFVPPQIIRQAKQFSKEMETALSKDLLSLRDLVGVVAVEEIGSDPEPINFKYARVMETLSAH